MLTYRRPHLTRTEYKFINRFIRPLGVHEDAGGNLWKVIGKRPRVLWSCHTDSVHLEQGRQKINQYGNIIHLDDSELNSNCLGADNAAGVWMLTQLIKAQKPGLYIFHRGEESGRIGSRWIAQNTPEMLDGIDMAIAFDRRGYNSVITHQLLERCCSEKFGNALAGDLSMGHRLDDGGSYTDTASYMRIIPECTNISIGFDFEHSKHETLNLSYISRLRDAVLELETDRLPIIRDPSVVEELTFSSLTYSGGYPKYSSYNTINHHNDDDTMCGMTMEDLIRYYPSEVADILRGLGYSAEDLFRELDEIYSR